MDKQESYLNCTLLGGVEKTQGRDGIGYYVAVYPEDQAIDRDLLFYESTFMSGTAVAIKFNDRNSKEAYEEIEKITFSNARARIALELFDIGKSYKQDIYIKESEQKESDIKDEDIQIKILKALLNIRKKDANKFKFKRLDVNGFCNILGISIEKYHFNASFLEEEGFIKESLIDQLGIANGGIYITSKGIKYLSGIYSEKLIRKNTHINENDIYFDVAISFAGAQRDLAEDLANKVQDAGFKVFLDSFYTEHLWGKDLVVFFDDIYRKKSKYCVIFVSSEYCDRMWTNHERKSAQARALEEKGKEYILPIKVNDSELQGMQPTIGYLSIKDNNIDQISKILVSKLKQKDSTMNNEQQLKEDSKIVNKEYISNLKNKGQLRWTNIERIEELKQKEYEIYFEVDEENKIRYRLENKSKQILMYKTEK